MLELSVPMLVLIAVAVVLSGVGGFFGTKKYKKATKTIEDVVTMVETRATLLKAINKKLDGAGWWTKRKIRKQLEEKGLLTK